MKTRTRKQTLPRTEADGTTVLDLLTWCRDDYGAFARGEITAEQYKESVAALQARIEALRR